MTSTTRRGHAFPILLAGAIAACLLAAGTLARSPRIVWNTTPSVEVGLYWLVRETPRCGDIAAVRLPAIPAALADRRRYLAHGALLLKPVAAVGRDRVCSLGNNITINGVPRARALNYDARGRALPRWHGCRTLRPQEVFLLGRRPDSFDGRYFGILATGSILGRAAPLWTP